MVYASIAGEAATRCERCGTEYPSEYFVVTEGVYRECFAKLPPAERQKIFEAHGIERMTTTAFTIDGHRIVRSMGIIRRITVRSRSIFGTIVGGDITLFTELCEETRLQAFRQMAHHAERMGANAVIGVRYDANEVMDGVTEVLCYGTAVVVELTR
jgi:uncharacterized protein YbjQ (UPF0145 family)